MRYIGNAFDVAMEKIVKAKRKVVVAGTALVASATGAVATNTTYNLTTFWNDSFNWVVSNLGFLFWIVVFLIVAYAIIRMLQQGSGSEI